MAILIRTINENDLPTILKWRNANRLSFFHKEEISPGEHSDWYHDYCSEPDNHLFVIGYDENLVGCIGIRLLKDEWDIYNVIRGEGDSDGAMGIALQNIISFAVGVSNKPVTARVLRGNEALNWYLKNGFMVTDEKADHFCIRFKHRPRRGYKS